jgi:hypothetical protein
MMGIFQLPTKYSADFKGPTNKPAGEVEIDWSNPLSKWVYDYWLLDSNHPKSIVRNQPYTMAGTGGTITPTSYITTSASYVDLGVLPVSEWDDLSLVVGYSDIGSASFNSGFAGINKNGTDDIRILIKSAPLDFRVDWDDGSFVTQLFSVANNGDNVIAISHSGGLATTFANGVLKNSNSDTLNTSGFSGELNLGSSLAGARNKVPASYKSCIVFKKGISSAALKSLTANPYQILKPKQAPVFFTPPSASGGISVIESTTNINIDSLNPSITLTGTVLITESTSNINVDSLNPSITLTATLSITESTSAIEVNALDPNITLTPPNTIVVTESLVNIDVETLNPTITLSGTLSIIESTSNWNVLSRDPTIIIGDQIYSNSFAGFISDPLVYSGYVKSNTFSGIIKEQPVFSGVNKTNSFIGVLK